MTTAKEGPNNDLSQLYQQMTEIEHILKKPDTYIGSAEITESLQWVFDTSSNLIIEKNISFVPGLYKLFDEGIVNCRDHAIRMNHRHLAAKAAETTSSSSDAVFPVTSIDVTVCETDGTITMTNDGNGIDVAQHPKYNIWIPELIFGHLRTSTNYDKTEKKIVGGKNGFGFKLVLIWSTFGSVETYDHVRGLKYTQEFRDNLQTICPPTVISHLNEKKKKPLLKPYTKITFRPDYVRLGLSLPLSPDILALLQKRVYDIAAITDSTVKVKWNASVVPVKQFSQYIALYTGPNVKRVYEMASERWEYAVSMSPTNEFQHVSFVNGIATSKGGKHVEYLLGQVVRKMVEYIETKKKVKVSPAAVKEQLFLFLRCDIENPSFDSQTKDCLNTPAPKFGSKCEVSDKFIENLAKLGVMEHACKIAEVRETRAAKKSDGWKTPHVSGIPKLTDAVWAGTEKSGDAVLILCEGDSAKAGIISGLSQTARLAFGVYPMKGKILNVRGETAKRLSENKEITEIKKILGLEIGKTYHSFEDVRKWLRYGKVLIMTDQDLDGSHIKGLIINLFFSEWPSLVALPGFLGFMNTPILKARKGTTSKELVFYNEGEFRQWKTTTNAEEVATYHIKYYKGLGTSTGKEFQEYFDRQKLVWFHHTGKESVAAVDMVFNKKRAMDRKQWLQNYSRDRFLDTSQEQIPYEEFIQHELIHFSKYDNDRSIPNIMDGLKVSQRKILFAAFKKNFTTTEMKVAQFSGYVSGNSGYHHGEASLNAAIIGLAQNFVGANNINLFVPSGQFGTRLEGGKDAAAERYIYTKLCAITRFLFPAADDAILTYLEDDGETVEPIFYAPILPMVLVNGAKGIGTGFSTEILCYNPADLIADIKARLQHREDGAPYPATVALLPYYEGFTGRIVKETPEKYRIYGRVERRGVDVIRITELPVGVWTNDFKQLLEQLREDGIVKQYIEESKETNVDFPITFVKGKLAEYPTDEDLYKLFKLSASFSTTNMHLFDETDKLKKYATVDDIVDNFFPVRLALYEKRKAYLVSSLQREYILRENKARYIVEHLAGTLDLRNKSKVQTADILAQKGYRPISSLVAEDPDAEESNATTAAATAASYHYLTKMPMDSVGEENVQRLFSEKRRIEQTLDFRQKQTIHEMWMEDLIQLEQAYSEYKQARNSLEKATTASEVIITTLEKKRKKNHVDPNEDKKLKK